MPFSTVVRRSHILTNIFMSICHIIRLELYRFECVECDVCRSKYNYFRVTLAWKYKRFLRIARYISSRRELWNIFPKFLHIVCKHEYILLLLSVIFTIILQDYIHDFELRLAWYALRIWKRMVELQKKFSVAIAV